MNQQEELVLKVLSSVDVIKGKTKFVKIVHLTCELFKKNNRESPFSFSSNNYGAYSPELEPVLDNLQNQGYISINTPFLSKRQDICVLKKYDYRNVAILEMNSKR